MTYRPIPEDEPKREREHHPVCAWCKFEMGPSNIRAAMMGAGTAICARDGFSLPEIHPGVNDRGQCDTYSPSLATRALQLVRIRPFVERDSNRWRNPPWPVMPVRVAIGSGVYVASPDAEPKR